MADDPNRGYELVIPSLAEEITLMKSTFGAMDLQHILLLRYSPIIEIVGVCTDICVVSNALLLRTICPEADIIVDASCCAGTTPEKHKAALEVMKSCHIDVINEGVTER
jgi:nicotinamidase-related amidase